MQFPPNHPQRCYVKKTTEATGLSQRTIFGYVRARSLLRQVPQLQLGTPSPELQASSTAAGIPVPDKTSPPATRKEHLRAFIVDYIDKCVIRRKSNNFTRSGSSYPPLTGCFQCHYVNVSVLIKFYLKKKTHSVFTLIIISSP